MTITVGQLVSEIFTAYDRELRTAAERLLKLEAAGSRGTNRSARGSARAHRPPSLRRAAAHAARIVRTRALSPTERSLAQPKSAISSNGVASCMPSWCQERATCDLEIAEPSYCFFGGFGAGVAGPVGFGAGAEEPSAGSGGGGGLRARSRASSCARCVVSMSSNCWIKRSRSLSLVLAGGASPGFCLDCALGVSMI